MYGNHSKKTTFFYDVSNKILYQITTIITKRPKFIQNLRQL